MNVELNTQIIEKVQKVLDRNNVLRTEKEVIKDYYDAINVLIEINKAIENEKIRYEEHLEDLIDNVQM